MTVAIAARKLLICSLCVFLLSCDRSYEGNNTLSNYPNLTTMESQLAKDVLLDVIGFNDENKNTQYVTAEQMVEITAFLYLGLHTKWVHDVDARSMNIRPTGPFINAVGYNTHQRARVYYSNEVIDWLLDDREGELPDGAMIVKQMYPTDPENKSYGGDKVTGWAVMIRDNKATKDGWLWFLFFFPDTPSYGSPVLLSQYGMSFCLSCHSGADTPMNTFSTINNLNGERPSQYTVIHGPDEIPNSAKKPVIAAGHSSQPPSFGLHVKDIKSLIARMEEHRSNKHEGLLKRIEEHLGDIPHEVFELMDEFIQDSMAKPVTKPLDAPNAAITSTFGKQPVAKDDVKKLPWDLFTGHTTASPDDLDHFITSDNCRGCHDASMLLGGRQPAMMVYKDVDEPGRTAPDKYNLAVYGEWGTSMMGLAGRDPIFHAQLESEQALRPDIKDWTADLCLSCHQVAGQRQFHLDGNDAPYTNDYTYAVADSRHADRNGVYGALGRDGVTCTVCHQITPEGLGDKSTFTGKFNINAEAGTVYGPYADDEIKPYYMQQGLGIKPVYGKQIKDSALCGSCHTINLPVLEPGATSLPGPDTKIAHEQTTYLEWVNSDFTDDADTTCQGCHMPGDFREKETLTTAIANVEDGDFPYVDNRASDDLITPEPKDNYRRHTLVGLSVIANRMFQQFPVELGITTLDPGTPLTYGPSAEGAIHRLTLTEQEMGLIAKESVNLVPRVTERTSNGWTVEVDLENLAGHKFPSGVGFRRAFLEVTALDASGNVLWGSGRTNKAGVILGQDGQALASEFTLDWRELQPDYAVINSEDQAQIFETRHMNTDGELTTSFLGLDSEMKDNRLLPRGWKADGVAADETTLHRLGGDAYVPPKPGFRTIKYEIPAAGIDAVRVRLLYQSTPPYYLRDRFSVSGPETDRLYYFASYVNLDDSIAKDWSVEVEARTIR